MWQTELARTGETSEGSFIKVDATKFTEVGYVGRDVSQSYVISRVAFRLVRAERVREAETLIIELVEREFDALIPGSQAEQSGGQESSGRQSF